MTQKCISIPIYTAGKEVYYEGKIRIVEHTILSKGILYVKLFNVYNIVDSKEITCEPTVFKFEIIDGKVITKV